MALIAKKSSFIAFCVQRDIVVYDEASGRHSRATVPNCATSSVDKTGEAESGDDSSQHKPPNKVVNGQITHLDVSENLQLLAVTTHSDKQLHLYRLDGQQLELLSQRDLVRATSAIRFTPDSKSLLVADKTGDCFLFDCEENVSVAGKWIFGHFSMVLDILLTPNSK